MANRNDLREEADVNYHFGEIKLWYEAQPKRFVGVIVEAKSDEILFRKLLNEDCVFFPVDGWMKAIEILELCKKFKMDAVLALIDADFKRILDFEMDLTNLFFTDFHDKEMMISHSQAWQGVLNSFAEPPKIKKLESANGKSLLDFLLQTIKPIGILRLINEREKLELKFKNWQGDRFKFIDYKDFIDLKTLKFDISKFLKTVENKSQKQGFFKNNPQWQKELGDLMSKDYDLKELCNGHDLVNVLAIALEILIGNHKSGDKVSGENLEKSLILAYRLDDFKQTKLFQALSEWQRAYPAYVLQRD